MTKLCSCGCGLPRDRPGQRYRQECHNRYQREWKRRRTQAFRQALERLKAEEQAVAFGKNVSHETITLLEKGSKGLP